jgi:hypothetical protein
VLRAPRAFSAARDLYRAPAPSRTPTPGRHARAQWIRSPERMYSARAPGASVLGARALQLLGRGRRMAPARAWHPAPRSARAWHPAPRSARASHSEPGSARARRLARLEAVVRPNAIDRVPTWARLRFARELVHVRGADTGYCPAIGVLAALALSHVARAMTRSFRACPRGHDCASFARGRSMT